MEQRRGPYPSVGARKQWSANDSSPMMALISGEFTASKPGLPIGAANVAGKISNVWLSVGASGKDDAQTLSVTADVKINGTSCLTTAPIIAHVSGEASTNKTTKDDADTGVTQCAMDPDANDVSYGDVITCDMTLTRTASPTTEMGTLAIVVEFEPA